MKIRLANIDIVECAAVEERQDLYLCSVLIESGVGDAEQVDADIVGSAGLDQEHGGQRGTAATAENEPEGSDQLGQGARHQ